MLFFTHLLAALIVGKLVGNYYYVLLGALLLDIDHLYIIFKNKYWSLRHLHHICIKNEKGLIGPRTWIHSFVGFTAICLLLLFFLEASAVLFFTIGYLTHLVLDLLDDCETHFFYPINYSVEGPIAYNSYSEYAIILILGIVYLLI